jgi:hypothetical protein
MEESKPIMELIFARGIPLSSDVSVDQRISRTQHVDRIVFDSVNDVIDVYLSPVVDREYIKRPGSGLVTDTKVTKKKIGTVVCECHHFESDHSRHIDGRARICLMPGCRCADYSKLEGAIIDDDSRKQATVRPVTDVDPIDDEDVPF